MKVCPVPGCPTLTTSGRCPEHTKQSDRARGTATQRGYTGKAHRAFRLAVLTRDPLCTCTSTCDHHLAADGCFSTSTVADHWPVSKRDLDESGQDSNDPDCGRGLCKCCHDKETATNQPGGWNDR